MAAAAETTADSAKKCSITRARPAPSASRDAGSYLCNYLSWRAIEAVGTDDHLRLASFVHVPPLARGGATRRKGYQHITLEELVEQLTWAQLGRHKKPILIANIEQFWEPLLALLDHMRKLEFIRSGLTFNLLQAERVEDILPKVIAAAQPVPEIEKEMAPVAAERM